MIQKYGVRIIEEKEYNKIRELKQLGKTYNGIRQEFGRLSYTTISNVLKSRSYTEYVKTFGAHKTSKSGNKKNATITHYITTLQMEEPDFNFLKGLYLKLLKHNHITKSDEEKLFNILNKYNPN